MKDNLLYTITVTIHHIDDITWRIRPALDDEPVGQVIEAEDLNEEPTYNYTTANIDYGCEYLMSHLIGRFTNALGSSIT